MPRRTHGARRKPNPPDCEKWAGWTKKGFKVVRVMIFFGQTMEKSTNDIIFCRSTYNALKFLRLKEILNSRIQKFCRSWSRKNNKKKPAVNSLRRQLFIQEDCFCCPPGKVVKIQWACLSGSSRDSTHLIMSPAGRDANIAEWNGAHAGSKPQSGKYLHVNWDWKMQRTS